MQIVCLLQQKQQVSTYLEMNTPITDDSSSVDESWRPLVAHISVLASCLDSASNGSSNAPHNGFICCHFLVCSNVSIGQRDSNILQPLFHIVFFHMVFHVRGERLELLCVAHGECFLLDSAKISVGIRTQRIFKNNIHPRTYLPKVQVVCEGV